MVCGHIQWYKLTNKSWTRQASARYAGLVCQIGSYVSAYLPVGEEQALIHKIEALI